MSSRRLDTFDGMRAFAVAAVLVYHLSLATSTSRVFVLGPFLTAMKGGVTIFFVISGFLLYVPYARVISRGDELPSWREYARRRVVRVLPAYWVALTLVGLSPVGSDIFSGKWWRYYGFAQIYDPHTILGGLGVSWTLCVEVTFYALVPLFAVAVAKLSSRIAAQRTTSLQLTVLAALAIASIALRGALSGAPYSAVPDRGTSLVLASSLPGLFDWFAIGMAMAVVRADWERDESRFTLIRAMVIRPGACWMLAGFVFTVSVILSPLDLLLSEMGALPHVLLGLAAGLFTLPALAPCINARARPARLLCNRRIAWLGTISYGVYLWQVWLLQALVGPLGRTALASPSLGKGVAVAVTGAAGPIALGAASWYFLEAPVQRRFKWPRRGSVHVPRPPVPQPARSSSSA